MGSASVRVQIKDVVASMCLLTETLSMYYVDQFQSVN